MYLFFAGLREHELLELFGREGPLAEKYGFVQVGFQGYLPGFEFVLGAPVSLFVIGGIERKTLGRFQRACSSQPFEGLRPDVPK